MLLSHSVHRWHMHSLIPSFPYIYSSCSTVMTADNLYCSTTDSHWCRNYNCYQLAPIGLPSGPDATNMCSVCRGTCACTCTLHGGQTGSYTLFVSGNGANSVWTMDHGWQSTRMCFLSFNCHAKLYKNRLPLIHGHWQENHHIVYISLKQGKLHCQLQKIGSPLNPASLYTSTCTWMYMYMYMYMCTLYMVYPCCLITFMLTWYALCVIHL